MKKILRQAAYAESDMCPFYVLKTIVNLLEKFTRNLLSYSSYIRHVTDSVNGLVNCSSLLILPFSRSDVCASEAPRL